MNVLILSAIWGIVMMFGGLVLKKSGQASILAIIGAIVLLLANIGDVSGMVITRSNFNNMLSFSGYGELFMTIILISVLLLFLLSGKDVELVGRNGSDCYALIFFVLTGITLTASFNNLLMLFIGIEIMSIPLYILTGSDKKNLKSNEAALKYFLMGSFSTGIMLLGITFIYGDTGSFILHQSSTSDVMGMFMGTPRLTAIGLLLLLVSLGFKVSAVPFHFWTPDVYDGSPTVFTGFMSTIVKAGGFIAFIRLFGAYIDNFPAWGLTMEIVIALTLFVGNVTAVFQQSVKRMMAYSSIAQAGFMLFAVFGHNEFGSDGFLVYTAAYSIATIGIFAVLNKMGDHTFEAFNGLAKKQPVLAFTMTIFLLSLAGIPLTAGFLGKYYMLSAAIHAGLPFPLTIFAVLCAAVSVYYYFRVIQAMYFKEGDSAVALPVSGAFKGLLVLSAILIILLGIFPYDLLINWKLFY